MIQIEKGIPLPAHIGSGRKRKYPWADLEVGDSIHIPGKHGASMASVASERHGIKLTARREGDGYRVWRYA